MHPSSQGRPRLAVRGNALLVVLNASERSKRPKQPVVDLYSRFQAAPLRS